MPAQIAAQLLFLVHLQFYNLYILIHHYHCSLAVFVTDNHAGVQQNFSGCFQASI